MCARPDPSPQSRGIPRERCGSVSTSSLHLRLGLHRPLSGPLAASSRRNGGESRAAGCAAGVRGAGDGARAPGSPARGAAGAAAAVALQAAPPAAHVCSDECTAEMCPTARALLEAAMSQEAAVLIIAAFGVWALGGGDGADSFFDEELQVAQVRSVTRCAASNTSTRSSAAGASARRSSSSCGRFAAAPRTPRPRRASTACCRRWLPFELLETGRCAVILKASVLNLDKGWFYSHGYQGAHTSRETPKNREV